MQVRWLVIFSLAVVAARGQGTLDPKQISKIEGRLVNAVTGEPVPRAYLTLTGSDRDAASRSARSDSDGRFLIDNVRPGAYRLIAERVGFLRQGYGSRAPGGSGSPLMLSAGQQLSGVEFRLTPQGVITGAVLDDQGDLLPRASVSAYRIGTLGTARQSSGGVVTNDIGEFRIAGLTPGRYLVMAAGQGRFMGRGGMGGGPGVRGFAGMPSPAPDEDLLPTYYPSSADPAGAAPLEVTAGQDVGGITIVLRRGSLYRVQGRVVGGTPQSPANLSVSLVRRGGGVPAPGPRSGGSVKPEGSFDIARVQPGSYYAVAMRMGRGGGVAGRAAVDLVSGDVTNLVLPIADPMPVTGTVRIEGEPKTSLTRLTVSLVPVEEMPMGGGGMSGGRVSEAGAFKIDSVSPDKFYLSFGGLPSGTYVKSVRMASQEVLDKGIDLTNARGNISLDVLLSPKAGSVEGTVTAGDRPAMGSQIVMLPDPIRAEQPSLNRLVAADQDGKFAISGLAPGDYKLYAFEESQPELAQDPGAIKPFEQKGVKLSVKEGGSEQVDLKVLKPEDALR